MNWRRELWIAMALLVGLLFANMFLIELERMQGFL